MIDVLLGSAKHFKANASSTQRLSISISAHTLQKLHAVLWKNFVLGKFSYFCTSMKVYWRNIFQLHPGQWCPGCMITRCTWMALAWVLTIASLLLARFSKCLVGGSCLCWPASLCGGRPFVHDLSICRLTGCYTIILIHPFLLWVLSCCLALLYPSGLKFSLVDVHLYKTQKLFVV